jgi:hypothetical protein
MTSLTPLPITSFGCIFFQKYVSNIIKFNTYSQEVYMHIYKQMIASCSEPSAGNIRVFVAYFCAEDAVNVES